MFHVCRAIRGVYAFLIQGGARYLYAFQYHFADMLVTMILGAGLNGLVEYENIHTLFTDKKPHWTPYWKEAPIE
jgi:hypothetical protein